MIEISWTPQITNTLTHHQITTPSCCTIFEKKKISHSFRISELEVLS